MRRQRGGMVTQRIANPCIPVRFWALPPKNLLFIYTFFIKSLNLISTMYLRFKALTGVLTKEIVFYIFFIFIFVLKISPSIILTLKLSFESLLPNIFDKVDLPAPDSPVNQIIFVINRALLNIFVGLYLSCLCQLKLIYFEWC